MDSKIEHSADIETEILTAKTKVVMRFPLPGAFLLSTYFSTEQVFTQLIECVPFGAVGYISQVSSFVLTEALEIKLPEAMQHIGMFVLYNLGTECMITASAA